MLLPPRYAGHTDVIRAVGYVKDCDTYVTASWDKSLRLWFRPRDRKAGAAGRSAGGGGEGSTPNMLLLEYDEDEEHFVSEYEKAHPLEMPKALTDVRRVGARVGGGSQRGAGLWVVAGRGWPWSRRRNGGN